MTSLRDSDSVKVAVVVTHLSHYREAVYRSLSKSEGYTFKYFGDIRHRGGIAPISAVEDIQYVATETLQFGPLLWQRGLKVRELVHDHDVIICLGDVRILSTWRIARLARRSDKKVLFWTHGWSRAEDGLKRRLRLKFYRLAHGILVYSNRGKARAIEYGLESTSVFRISNGLSARAELPVKSVIVEDKNPARVVIGAVTRVTRSRNFELLLRSMKILVTSGRRVEFHLAGEGSALKPLKILAQSLNVPLATFGPIYEQSHLMKFYDNVDVCVMPNAGGLAIIQSLSFGVPVICGDDIDGHGPEVEAVIPDETGFYFRANDEHSLAEAIEKYATLSLEDRAKMSEAARSLVIKEWTADYQAAKILEAIGIVLTQ